MAYDKTILDTQARYGPVFLDSASMVEYEGHKWHGCPCTFIPKCLCSIEIARTVPVMLCILHVILSMLSSIMMLVDVFHGRDCKLKSRVLP